MRRNKKLSIISLEEVKASLRKNGGRRNRKEKAAIPKEQYLRNHL